MLIIIDYKEDFHIGKYMIMVLFAVSIGTGLASPLAPRATFMNMPPASPALPASSPRPFAAAGSP
jgi:hypothetical protein